jgi:hypothetical protein
MILLGLVACGSESWCLSDGCAEGGGWCWAGCDEVVPAAAGVLAAQAIGALPEGWQATALPGYVILYHEDATYASAQVMWRKRDGTVSEITGAARLDEPGAIDAEEAGDDE